MGNSVIYRPAYDAEVEYLESTGTQWIDTGVYGTSDTELEFTASFGYGTLNVGVVSWDDTEGKTLGIAYNSSNNTLFSFLGNQFGATIIQLSPDTAYDFVVKQNGVWIGSQKTYNGTYLGSIQTDYTLPLFARRENTRLSYSLSARFYYFKIYQNSTLVRDFIPVRIGSIGYLYDKVTKQLFANKGTGQFTLGNDVSNAVIPQQRCVLYFESQRSVIYERIYEEYEWLKGDGSAYIDTNIIIDPSLLKLTAKVRPGNNGVPAVFGSRDENNANTYTTSSFRLILNSFRMDILSAVEYQGYWEEIYIDINYPSGFVNGVPVERTKIGMPVKSQYTFRVFDTYLKPSNIGCFNGSVGLMNIDDNTYHLNFVPCKLLQPIPAILDGNGIARQAGECGMWDKVSNKFYGNVASSGSFSVSND